MVTSIYQPGDSVNEVNEYLRKGRFVRNFWQKEDVTLLHLGQTGSGSYRTEYPICIVGTRPELHDNCEDECL
jgi:hypothetical protein